MRSVVEVKEMPSVAELYEFTKSLPADTVVEGGALPREIKRVIRGDDNVRIVLNCSQGDGPTWAGRMVDAARRMGYYVFNDTYRKEVDGKNRVFNDFLVYLRQPKLSVLMSSKSEKCRESNGFLVSFLDSFGQIHVGDKDGGSGMYNLDILDAYLKTSNSKYRESFGGLTERTIEKSRMRKFYEKLIKIF